MQEELDVVDALRSVAMLVRVRTKAPGEIRIDRETTREVEHDKGADEGTVATQVKRFKAAKEWDGAIRKHQRDANKVVKARTIPWGESEERCLPTENFMDLVRDFKKHEDAVISLAAGIAERAHEIADLCNRSLGKLEVDPVTADTFIGTYALSIEFHEIPEGNFPSLPGPLQAKLQAQYKEMATARYHEGLTLGLKRLIEPMTKLIERLEKYDHRDPEAKDNTDTFKDTIITNVADVVNVLGSFNMLKDPELQKLIDELTVFKFVKGDMLRRDEKLRRGVRLKAQETIDRLSKMMGEP